MLIKLIEIIAFLWAGMILGISFLESWVKFRAPSLTKPIGLDVGRTVFRFFHKVQCCLFILIIIFSFFARLELTKWIIIASLAGVLIFQKIWLFPKLSRQVDIILAGNSISRSMTHTLYGIFEICKFIILILLGTNLMA